jgi:hypothetical protein
MSALREAAVRALDALDWYAQCAVVSSKAEEAADAIRSALAQQEQRAVPVPEGLALSDAEFWLNKRADIIDACKAQGFTIVTTAHGVHLMRLGEIKAQGAQAPVAHSVGRTLHWHEGRGINDAQLFTTPPHREWQGLTDEEIDAVTDAQWAANNHKPIYAAHRAYARAVEQALKEKNA